MTVLALTTTRWAAAITGSGRNGINLLEPAFARMAPATALLVTRSPASPAPPTPPLARQAPAPVEELPPLPRSEAPRLHEPIMRKVLRCVAVVLVTMFRACPLPLAVASSGLTDAVHGFLGERAQAQLPVGPHDDCCVVCMDAVPTHALVPCGHRCVCGACAPQLQNCPLCRKRSTGSLRVFT